MVKISIFLLFFTLGIFSLSAQTILFREYLIVFNGNELGIGIFYSAWLFWVAMGATLLLFKKKMVHYFLLLFCLYPIALIVEFNLIRYLKKLAGLASWELFPLSSLLPLTFISNMPVSLLTGILFAAGCQWLMQELKEKKLTPVISSAYVLESLGSFLGGALITYLIIKEINPINLLIYLSILIYSIGLTSCLSYKKKFYSFFYLILFLLSLSAHFKRNEIISFLENKRWQLILPSSRLKAQTYTPYQWIASAQLKGQTVILSNGKVITSFPNKILNYQTVALLLSVNDIAKDVLLIGIGSEAIIRYMLDFPINSLTYVLSDKKYYKFIWKLLPTDFKRKLKDARFKVIFQDPRYYLSKLEKKKFDLIIVNTPDPNTARLNRYYTVEFYQLLKKRLKQDGMIATQISSAENYIGTEIKNYGSSTYYSLKEVFPEVLITPGERNWFFAGNKKARLSLEPQILKERYLKFCPALSPFHAEGFYSLLLPRRIKFVKEIYTKNILFDKLKLRNKDNTPLTYFLNLLVLARYTNSRLVNFLKTTFFAGQAIFLLPLIIFLILRLNWIKKISKTITEIRLFNAKFFQFVSGLSAFSYHLLLIYLFQNRFGNIFQLNGIVNCLFMLGLVIGGYYGKFMIRYNIRKVIITVLILLIALYLFCFPFISYAINPLSDKVALISYFIFFIIGGILAGISYPLAAKVLEEEKGKILPTASWLELLDHWGAALGALIGGIFLIPLLGIAKSFYILILLISVCLLFYICEGTLRLNPYRKFSFPYLKTSYFLCAISLWSILTFAIIGYKENIVKENPALIILQSLYKDKLIKFKRNPLPHYSILGKKEKYYAFFSNDLGINVAGFGGIINLLLVLDKDGRIITIRIAESQETPAYIKNINTWFNHYFIGKSINDRFQLGKNVNAISGATVTSQAIVKLINQSLKKIAPAIYHVKISMQDEKTYLPLSIYLFILSSILALIVFFFLPQAKLLRKLFLVFNLIVFGIIFNIQFSLFHLSNLFILKFHLAHFLLLILSIPLFLSFLFGPIYCGYICPFGALQELIHIKRMKDKLHPSLERKARYFKYILLTLLIALISIMRKNNIFSLDPLANAFQDKLFAGSNKILVILVLFSSLFFFRFWCRYFCPVGAFLNLGNKICILRKFIRPKNYNKCDLGVKGNYDLDCIQCNRCIR